MKFLLTCDPGFEAIARKEILEKIPTVKKVEVFHNFQGKLLVEVGCSEKKLFSLRSIHHIILLIDNFLIQHTNEKGLEEIYTQIRTIKMKKFLKGKKTFRVTTQRVGEHTFTSVDVQRVAGKAIVEKYKARVDLKNFDVNIRVDVFGHEVIVGIQLTKESLYKRFVRVFNHPAGIKTTIAYGLLMLANVQKGNTVLDPMCGGGTILLEAASIWKNKIKIIGGDINKKYLEGARENVKANGLERYVQLLNLDARKLDEYFEKDSVDRIVTNPPYGIRMKPKGLKQLYKQFLESASAVLRPDGRMVVLTVRADAFRTIVFRTKKYKIVSEHVVESGGLYPHVFVLEKI